MLTLTYSTDHPNTLTVQSPHELHDGVLLAALIHPTSAGSTISLTRWLQTLSILEAANGWAGLSRATADELIAAGIDPHAAYRMVAAVEVGRRVIRAQHAQRPTIHRPADIADLMLDMGALETEHLRVVLLDTGRHVMKVVTVVQGTLNSTPVRPAEVFRDAIRLNAASIALAHNHPSSSVGPSPDDITLTRTLIDAGKLLGIPLVEHMVIGQGTWASIREADPSLGWESDA